MSRIWLEPNVRALHTSGFDGYPRPILFHTVDDRPSTLHVEPHDLSRLSLAAPRQLVQPRLPKAPAAPAPWCQRLAHDPALDVRRSSTQPR